MDVLPLVAVHEEAVKHVAEVDEELGSPHGLEEVVGTAHFGHEFDEQHCTAIGVDCLHQTVDRGTEI